MTPTVHELKCWPEPFEALVQGLKNFEFRKNDRDYQVGDVLHLKEWAPDEVVDATTIPGGYTGRELRKQVTYILRGPASGLADDFVVMAVKPDPPVHILLHGFALCGRIGIPRDWPEGEKWVGRHDFEQATCIGCQAVNRQMFPSAQKSKR